MVHKTITYRVGHQNDVSWDIGRSVQTVMEETAGNSLCSNDFQRYRYLIRFDLPVSCNA